MTREEAIAHGKEQLEIFGGEHREFIEMAIKALEQEPCEDAISRQAVLDNIKNGFHWESVNGITAETVLKQVIHDVEIMPSVQPKADETMVSVRPDENGYYPNVCGMCINNESELCDSCEYNSNFKKETSKPSFYKKGKTK